MMRHETWEYYSSRYNHNKNYNKSTISHIHADSQKNSRLKPKSLKFDSNRLG